MRIILPIFAEQSVSSYRMDILSYIKQERKRAKITQEQAANRLNICVKTYAAIEGGNSPVTIAQLQAIMEMLDMEIYVVTSKIHK